MDNKKEKKAWLLLWNPSKWNWKDYRLSNSFKKCTNR